MVSGSVPYVSTSEWSSRRVTSPLIHSRACCSEMYSTAGRAPSGTCAAPAVTRTATMSRRSTDRPTTSVRTRSGWAAARASISAWRPPAPSQCLHTVAGPPPSPAATSSTERPQGSRQRVGWKPAAVSRAYSAGPSTTSAVPSGRVAATS